QPGPAFSLGWGRLARALGLGLREAQWYLRLSFAEDEELDFALAAAVSPGRLGVLQAAQEAALDEMIACWDETRRTRLEECERLLREHYHHADLAEPPSP